MDFTRDHFALLGLPRRFALDITDLERRYRDVQARVHPDRHLHEGESGRRLAMQWATQANDAYQTLRDPLRRAGYLLKLDGIDPELERNAALPADFLVEQMELREAVAEARRQGDGNLLEEIHGRIELEMKGRFASLQHALDEATDRAVAVELVRRLMFQDKLLREINDALEATDA